MTHLKIQFSRIVIFLLVISQCGLVWPFLHLCSNQLGPVLQRTAMFKQAMGLYFVGIASRPDPAGVNGAIYYNTTNNKFRCYESGAWKYLFRLPLPLRFLLLQRLSRLIQLITETISRHGTGRLQQLIKRVKHWRKRGFNRGTVQG